MQKGEFNTNLIANPNHKIILSYSIEHLEKTEKVKFFYALKGRNGKQGFIPKNKIKQLGRAVLLVPAESSSEAINFLKLWGCKFDKQEVLLVNESE